MKSLTGCPIYISLFDSDSFCCAHEWKRNGKGSWREPVVKSELKPKEFSHLNWFFCLRDVCLGILSWCLLSHTMICVILSIIVGWMQLVTLQQPYHKMYCYSQFHKIIDYPELDKNHWIQLLPPDKTTQKTDHSLFCHSYLTLLYRIFPWHTRPYFVHTVALCVNSENKKINVYIFAFFSSCRTST